MPDPQNTGLPILASAPRVKDPVCGMMVDPQKSAAKVAHGGQDLLLLLEALRRKI